MLQPNLSLEIVISTTSRKQPSASLVDASRANSNPIKIRFAAVTSATMKNNKEAVQSE